MVDSGKIAQQIKRVLTGSGFTIEMENAEGRKELDERKARRFYETKGKFMVAYDVGEAIRFHRGKNAEIKEIEGIRKSCQKIANKFSLNWKFAKFNQRIHPKKYRDEPVKRRNDEDIRESMANTKSTLKEWGIGMEVKDSPLQAGDHFAWPSAPDTSLGYVSGVKSHYDPDDDSGALIYNVHPTQAALHGENYDLVGNYLEPAGDSGYRLYIPFFAGGTGKPGDLPPPSWDTPDGKFPFVKYTGDFNESKERSMRDLLNIIDNATKLTENKQEYIYVTADFWTKEDIDHGATDMNGFLSPLCADNGYGAEDCLTQKDEAWSLEDFKAFCEARIQGVGNLNSQEIESRPDGGFSVENVFAADHIESEYDIRMHAFVPAILFKEALAIAKEANVKGAETLGESQKLGENPEPVTAGDYSVKNAKAALAQLDSFNPAKNNAPTEYSDKKQAALNKAADLVSRIPDDRKYDALVTVMDGIVQKMHENQALGADETELFNTFVTRANALGAVNQVAAGDGRPVSMVNRVRAAFQDEEFAGKIRSAVKGVWALNVGGDPEPGDIIGATLPILDKKDQVLYMFFDKMTNHFKQERDPSPDEWEPIEEFLSLVDAPDNDMMRRAESTEFAPEIPGGIPESVMQFESEEKKALWMLENKIVNRVCDAGLQTTLRNIIESARNGTPPTVNDMGLVLEVAAQAKQADKPAMKKSDPISEARAWIGDSLKRAFKDNKTLQENEMEPQGLDDLINQSDMRGYGFGDRDEMEKYDANFNPGDFVDKYMPSSEEIPLDADDLDAASAVDFDNQGNPIHSRLADPADEPDAGDSELMNSVLGDLDRAIAETKPVVFKDGDIVALNANPNTSVGVFKGIKNEHAFIVPTDTKEGWQDVVEAAGAGNIGTYKPTGMQFARLSPAALTRFQTAVAESENTDDASKKTELAEGFYLEAAVAENTGGTTHVLKDKDGNETGLTIAVSESGAVLKTAKSEAQLESLDAAIAHLNRKIAAWNSRPATEAVEPAEKTPVTETPTTDEKEEKPAVTESVDPQKKQLTEAQEQERAAKAQADEFLGRARELVNYGK